MTCILDSHFRRADPTVIITLIVGRFLSSSAIVVSPLAALSFAAVRRRSPSFSAVCRRLLPTDCVSRRTNQLHLSFRLMGAAAVGRGLPPGAAAGLSSGAVARPDRPVALPRTAARGHCEGLFCVGYRCWLLATTQGPLLSLSSPPGQLQPLLGRPEPDQPEPEPYQPEHEPYQPEPEPYQPEPGRAEPSRSRAGATSSPSNLGPAEVPDSRRCSIDRN